MRELSAEDVSRQALALHSYVSRGGDARLWLESKGFALEDERAVKREFLRRLASTGMRPVQSASGD